MQLKVTHSAPPATGEAPARVGTARDRLDAPVHFAEAELDAIAACFSHALRTPVWVMEHFIRTLGQKGPSDSPDFRVWLDRALGVHDQIRKLVEGLALIAEISGCRLSFDSLNISGLAVNIFEELRAAQPERTVELRVTTGLQACGDPALIEMALRRLIENAWKFTQPREVGRVEIGSTPTDNARGRSQTVFFVRDNGVGFDPELAGKLFQPCQRLHADKVFEGAGMGLACVRRIVHRHGGRVWAQSQADAGASFFFSLPSQGGTKPGAAILDASEPDRVRQLAGVPA